jgi:hypothetical protein
MGIQWDEQSVAALSSAELQKLRNNALRIGSITVATLCDAELAKRPTRIKAAPKARKVAQNGRYVTGFHFVCDADKGVTMNPDGTFWSGVWVVDEIHGANAPKVGAYLALHKTRAEPSYRQGLVKDWRKTMRNIAAKTEDGIEFLIEPTDQPYEWVGAGTGEKGYRWDG